MNFVHEVLLEIAPEQEEAATQEVLRSDGFLGFD
jgi:hypothetical protein